MSAVGEGRESGPPSSCPLRPLSVRLGRFVQQLGGLGGSIGRRRSAPSILTRHEQTHTLRQRAISADNRSMLKSIRDLWGRATQKKAMKPEVRSMLLDLDGVYERREAVVPQQDEQNDEPREAAG